jgi:hypothetical protein
MHDVLYLSLLALCMKSLCRLFPVHAIKALQRKGCEIHAVNATNIDRPSGGIQAWPAERMNTAVLAGVVLGRFRIELVQQ